MSSRRLVVFPTLPLMLITLLANVSSYCILQFRSKGTKSVLLSEQRIQCNEVHLMTFGAHEAKKNAP